MLLRKDPYCLEIVKWRCASTSGATVRCRMVPSPPTSPNTPATNSDDVLGFMQDWSDEGQNVRSTVVLVLTRRDLSTVASRTALCRSGIRPLPESGVGTRTRDDTQSISTASGKRAQARGASGKLSCAYEHGKV